MAGGAAVNEVSAIRAEEQSEILEQIDSKTASHKLAVTDELFVVHATRNGALFPLLVNVGALVLIAVSVFGLWRVFDRDAEVFQQNRQIFTSVENQLIRRLREESRDQLQRKEAEISDIENRLRSIADERNRILASIDERVREREAALREQLEGELAAERARLNDQGVEGSQLEDRLNDFQRDRAATVDEELAAFRAEIDQERRLLEEDLLRVQGEYDRQLAELSSERDQLVAGFRAREEDLRRQLESRTRALESDRATAQSDLAAAQARLSLLTQNREAELALQTQVSGYLNRIRDAIARNAYAEVGETIASFRSFLNPSTGTPVLYSRRDMDLFFIDTLERLVGETLDQAAQTESLTAGLTQLRTIRSTLDAGDRLLNDGDAAAAERTYRDAFSAIDGLIDAHVFLVDQSTSRLRGTLEGEAQDVILPLRNRIVEYEQTILELQARELAVQAELAARNAAVSENNRRIDEYTLQLAAATERIAAITGERDRLDGALESTRGEIADLRTHIDTIERRLATSRDDAEALNDEVDQLSREAATLQSEAEVLRREAHTLRNERAEIVAAIEVARTENRSLRDDVVFLEALQEGYRNFLMQEAAVLTGREAGERGESGGALARGETGGADYLAAKVHLDTFLGSPEMQRFFPDILDRVHTYDRAFEEAGYQHALLDINDLMEEVAFFPDPRERNAYLQRGLADEENSPEYRRLLESLRSFVTDTIATAR